MRNRSRFRRVASDVMKYSSLLVAVVSVSALAQNPAPKNIRRLDGSTISIGEADAFAKKTLEAAHVTGAQIAVLNDGKLVWSGVYGLRRKDPDLPMDAETTTWAASI